MNCNYKVKLDDIQNKYKFNIFCTGSYNDSDLRKMIESVYYALPRTTGTGTSVTLNDTAFSYMKNKLYATDTSQYTTNGYNLVDTLATNTAITGSGLTYSRAEDGEITISGTSNRAWDYVLTTNFTFKAGKTYTFSHENNGSMPVVLYINFNSNNGGQLSVNQYTHSATRTIVEDQTVAVKWSLGSGQTVLYKLKIMVEEGSTTHDYEPYTGGKPAPSPTYPYPIHEVSGDNEVVVCGKNLIGLGTQLNGYRDGNTGKFQEQNIAIGYYFLTSELPDTITISSINGNRANISYYNAIPETSVPSQDYSNSNEIPRTININKAYPYIHIQFSYNQAVNNIMINEGSTALTYEPYQSNSVLLTLGDKEICKIGNYEDKIFKAIKGNEIYDSLSDVEKASLDYGKWYLRKETGKMVLNGSSPELSSYVDASRENVYTCQASNTTLANITTSGLGICNILKEVNYSYVYGNESYYLASNILVFKINKSTIDSQTGSSVLEKIKAYLNTTNLIICGGLKTPTNEKFNDTIQEQLEDIYNNMLSYEGQTYVSQVNDDLPFNINSTAIKDLNDL